MFVTVDLSVIAWFIIFCIAVVVGIFIIILLKNCLKVVDKVNKILDVNSESIEKTITALPSAIESVDGLAVSAKQTMDKATSVVSTVEDSVTETIDSFSFNAENVLSIINIASSVVKSILSAFSKK
jgi:methyl-accepting chemotaxis protein